VEVKFGPKLFVVLAGLILTVLVLSAWLAGVVLQRTYVEISERAIAAAADVAQATITGRDARSHLLMRPLVNDARIKGRLMARNGLGQQDTGEIREAGNDYFGSWMDEYWVFDRDKQAEQDLLLLVGRDGTVAYGLVDEGKEHTVGDEVLGHQQLAALLEPIAKGEESGRMLWAGERLRTRAPIIPGLGHGLYFAEANRVVYSTAGTGGDELAGIAVVATHRLDLDRVLGTGADAIFVDHGTVAYSTFGLHDAGTQQTRELETAAMAWLSANPAADGGLQSTELAGEAYYAQHFEPQGGLTPGPVKAGLFYSRQTERMTTQSAREQLASIGGVLALLAVGVSVLLSRGLSRPIAEISRAASRVAGGDLKVVVPVLGRDELGDLASRFNEMVKGLQERENARAALGQYLSPEMAADLMKQQGRATLEGVRRDLTILFCDVAGFTTISEQLAPEALVGLLNRYLDRMVKILIAEGAYVDKFEGDAIMAFWNAPREVEGHALKACSAILQMKAEAAALSAEWKASGMAELQVRYGLHTGAAIVGNIGATDKLNYTAIGDNVNLASRLEGANKQYGTRLIISQSTWEAAKAGVEVRELDVVKVKGKAVPVRIFELLALSGGLNAEQQKARDAFEAGLKLYRAKRFSEAKAIFDAAGDDGPSRTFAARCARFAERPPGPDWDGTYEMETK
jgi:class 3 adenylate cyclase